jgi:3-oxoacyl-[acyl-carrier protein] reductase
MTLQGKVALVTGAGGGGVGAATAHELAMRGARVIVNYRSDRASAERVADSIMAKGGEAYPHQADLADPGQITEMVRRIAEEHGRLDIVASTKGSGPDGPTPGPAPGQPPQFTDLSWEQLSAHIASRLRVALTLAQAALPIMKAQRHGRLIYVSTEHARGPSGAPGMIANGTSAAGLNAFVTYLACELGPTGITANVVSPGMILTDQTLRVLGPAGPGIAERIINATPLRRPGRPEDTARVIAFFAADDASFLTGVCTPVTGGLGLARMA